MLETIAGLGFMWYFGFFAFFVVMSILSEFDKTGWETILVVALIVLANFFGPLDTWEWIKTETMAFVTNVVSWLAIGTAWATAKWVRFVRKRRSLYVQLKQKWIDKHPEYKVTMKDAIPDEAKRSFKDFLESESFLNYNNKTIAPLIRKHVDQFYNWIIFWPFSIFSTIFNDILLSIYEYLKGFMQKISDKIFGDYKNDLGEES